MMPAFCCKPGRDPVAFLPRSVSCTRCHTLASMPSGTARGPVLESGRFSASSPPHI